MGILSSMAQAAVGTAKQQVRQIVGGAVSGFLESLFGAGLNGGAEDFNVLKQTTKKLVRTDFQKEWLFRLEVDGEPSDFDLYVKDISFGGFDLNVDEEQNGGVSMAWPTARQAEKISFTVRDHTDGRIYRFVKAWAASVVHPDGTVGLPYGLGGYVRTVRRYDLDEGGGTERLADVWEAFPVQCGEISRSRENGGFSEFSVTFSVFSTGAAVTI